MERDRVDHVIEQWAHERPDLDTSPMEIVARMSRLFRYLERAIGEVLGEHGLNESQFGVLAALRRAGQPYTLSPTQLYNSLLISSGAMTNRLERLTAMGLVKRIAEPADRRSLLVALTPKGLKVVDAAVQAHVANERRLLASLSRSERRELAALLRKLVLSFEADDPRAQEGLETARQRGNGRRRSAEAARR